MQDRGRKLSGFFDPVAGKAGFVERRGRADPLITGLEYDSRKVKPGYLYFALPGLHADGHDFIPEALRRGAAGIIHEKPLEFPGGDGGPVFIRVRDARLAMSPAAASYYGYPGERLVTIGVTGTEGKSTTVSLIWQLLRLAGKKAGFISTVQYSESPPGFGPGSDFNGGEAEWNPEHQTTPEAVTLHHRLARMEANGAEYAVVEASSHGLSERTGRLAGLDFDAAVMTNVTHEHLEFHGTWEQYRGDKANLFRSLDRRRAAVKPPAAPEPFGVVNAADKSAPYFAAACGQKILSYSALPGVPADLGLLSLESGPGGNRYEALHRETGKTSPIEDRLPGAFNAGNVLAALLTVSHLLGADLEALVPLVPRLRPVRGRMTAVDRGQPFEVLVDYAHTPSSFETIFPPLRLRINRTGGRIISLFGSGGERDRKKRPQQGRIAAAWSDTVILTDEDPRGEEPLAILEEIAAGIKSGAEPLLIPSRPLAIRRAFSLARPGDLVLLLGKGHENSIIYGDRILEYDEIAEAEKALGEMGYAPPPPPPS